MTQEKKQLLLKDLCARLPYGVRMKGVNEDFELSISTSPKRLSYVLNSVDFKPYLRSMSSMTEEEIEELKKLSSGVVWRKDVLHDIVLDIWYNTDSIDWLNKKGFDYRGLIPMGLALPATEGMYNIKKQE